MFFEVDDMQALEQVLRLSYFKRRFVSKWFILLLDLIIISGSLLVVVSFTHSHFDGTLTLKNYYNGLMSVLLFAIVGHLIFKPHQGVIRYTSIYDIQRVFFARSLSVVLNIFYSLFVAAQLGIAEYRLPVLTLITNYVLSLFLLILARLSIKFIFQAGKNNIDRPKIMIYGAGEAGHITLNVLSSSFDVVAFVDDNALKKGKLYDGVKILHSKSDIKKFVEKNDVKQIVISVQNCTPAQKKEIYNKCIDWDLEVKSVPPIEEWIDGELTKSQIKSIKIEDLLGRDAIELDNFELKKEFTNKTILVTGAAGSIGSEIVRQLLNFSPHCILMLDQAETPMYHLEMEMATLKSKQHIQKVVIIADVRDLVTMTSVFSKYKIDYIFHAAAYKHVPSMELNPCQAVKVNLLGTKLIADLAEKHQVSKMVLISTDKAVNPTNVMGATKRAAEIYVQSKNQHSKTAYITTRFGNVLGSNGSVIPLFKKQIDEGGPITVTHPDITRYFMTIPEACQLVLEAGHIGKGGEIFVFDMGKSVKIVDLAKKMIRLSGLEFNKDITIEFVGLRPGEKLYEELLNDSEEVMPTHHQKIMISKVAPANHEIVIQKIQKIAVLLAENEDENRTVKLLKEFVPEFISKNSKYEKLDVHIVT